MPEAVFRAQTCTIQGRVHRKPCFERHGGELALLTALTGSVVDWNLRMWLISPGQLSDVTCSSHSIRLLCMAALVVAGVEATFPTAAVPVLCTGS